MDKYVQMYTGTWGDKKFRNLPSSDCRLMFMYLFSNSKVNLSGIYQLDLDVMRIETRINDLQFQEAFDYLTSSTSVANIDWDKNTETIWVMNRFKLIPNKSPKIVVGVLDELNIIKHQFKTAFIKRYHDDIKDYLWRLNGFKKSQDTDIPNSSLSLTDEFIINASRIYSGKTSLKKFFINRGFTEYEIETAITRLLPNIKP